MQNHLQYSANLGTGTPNMGSPKINSQHYIKSFEKTLPTNPIKHYSSNPNISLESNPPKFINHHASDFVPYNYNLPSKISDFKNQVNSPKYANNGSQAGPRPNRSEMTKSLIISDMEKHQTPEVTLSPKKQLFKNIPKRAYRMSETLQEQPAIMARHGGGTANLEINKQTNFYKNKQVERDEKKEEKKEPNRQLPSFLRSNNDMKRSLVVEASFDAQFQYLKNPPKAKTCVDDFVKIKELGNGKYGRVYLVKQKSTNFICALKVIEKKLLHEEEITDQFTREVKIQMFLNHPNIIKMYGCFHDAVNIYIILEVGTGGQLYHQLKKAQPLSQTRIAFIMRQVCEAVNEIHSLRIIHRDIKPQNIVLHDNIIKLCDFGWSVHQDNKLRTTFCGTPLYVCPQILKGREYDEKIDIWSIGIMMYEMVVGENPFKITKEQQLIKIVKDEIKIPSYLFVSPEVRDFLDKCLQKNPNDRASIKELINHPFFKKDQEKNEKAKMITI